VTFLQLFVNKFSFTSNLSFLAFLGFATPNFYHLQFAFVPSPFDSTGAHRGAPISDPARFCWNFNTRRAGDRRSGGSARMCPSQTAAIKNVQLQAETGIKCAGGRA
jgi:hypothetical protein